MQFEDIFPDDLAKFRRHFECAGYDDAAELMAMSKAKTEEVLRVIASDMAADGLSMSLAEHAILLNRLQSIKTTAPVDGKASRPAPRQRQPSSGGGIELQPLHTHRPYPTASGLRQREEQRDIEALLDEYAADGVGAKDAHLSLMVCWDGLRCLHQKWILLLSITICVASASLLGYIAHQQLRSKDAEVRNPSLAGAWLFLFIISVAGLAVSGLSCLLCVFNLLNDPSFYGCLDKLSRCDFTCDCNLDDLSCDCTAACRGCFEPGGLCYSDPDAPPCICFGCRDPDAKPFCYCDPDAPPCCCAPNARFCATHPDCCRCECAAFAPCCDPDFSCMDKCTDCCDFSRLECHLPDCSCRCDCLPAECCTDFIAFCNTCIKLVTCQFKIDLS